MKKICKYILIVMCLFLCGIITTKAEIIYQYESLNKGQTIQYSPDGTNSYQWIVLEDSPSTTSTAKLLLNQDLEVLKTTIYNTTGNSRYYPDNLYTVVQNATSSWTKLNIMSVVYDSSVVYNPITFQSKVKIPTKAELQSIGLSNMNAAGSRFWTTTAEETGTDGIFIVYQGKFVSVDINGVENPIYIRPIIEVVKGKSAVGTAMWHDEVTIKTNEKLDLKEYFSDWQNALNCVVLPDNSGVTYENGIFSSSKPLEIEACENTPTSEGRLKIKVVKDTVVSGSPWYETGKPIVMYVGDEKTTAANIGKATWTSSDSSIVRVDSEGKMTALKEGVATITGTNSGNVYNVEVTILKKEQQSIPTTIQNKNYIAKNENIQLDNPKNYKNIKWESSDSNIATVDSNGKVTGVKNGTVIVKGISDEGIYIYEVTIANKVSTETKDNEKVEVMYQENTLPTGIEIKADNVSKDNETYKKIEKRLKNVNKFEVYDIDLLKDNKIVQPNGEIVIVLDVPQGFDSKKIVVFRVESDDSITKVPSKVVDGKIQVYTSHFSNYIVAEVNEVDKDASYYVNDTANKNTNNNDNPQTGAIISISVISIAVLSILGIYLYTKKKNKLIRL